MESVAIRSATAADIAAITAIYAEAVREGTGTFELDPPDEVEMARRFAALEAGGFPRLVAVEAGRVLGYAYVGPFRARPAYRFTIEDSIYVDPRAQGRGIGRQLLSALITMSAEAGFRQMLAVIGDSANRASIGLHRALGFHPAGTFEAVGWKHRRWLDIVLMQRRLGDGHARPPGEQG